jgi:hypothetical protein
MAMLRAGCWCLVEGGGPGPGAKPVDLRVMEHLAWGNHLRGWCRGQPARAWRPRGHRTGWLHLSRPRSSQCTRPSQSPPRMAPSWWRSVGRPRLRRCGAQGHCRREVHHPCPDRGGRSGLGCLTWLVYVSNLGTSFGVYAAETSKPARRGRTRLNEATPGWPIGRIDLGIRRCYCGGMREKEGSGSRRGLL